MNQQKPDIITVQEIEQRIPEKIRPFLVIATAPLPRSFYSVIQAFWTAVELIHKATRINNRIHIIFGKSPFTVNLESGTLVYTHKEQVINSRVENIIFFNCEKMMAYKFHIQVTCILEEFVHVLMNISDEAMTTNMVGVLYNGVNVIDGKYHPIN